LENHCQVLVVDAAEETRDVLQTALQRLGRKTLTTGRADQGLALAREHRPELVVLDLEIEGHSSTDLAARFAEQLPAERTSLVLLGSARRPPLPGEFVAKPYHYAPLIRKIEEILSAGPAMVSDQEK
jgi:CheY-like chemotaxis protein